MVSNATADTYRLAGRHERTGYPLLDLAEQVVAVLGGEPATCANCWWCKGGHWGASFADGKSATWMSVRCERRYVELLDAEYERTPECGNDFGPGYARHHRRDAACGSPTVRVDRGPSRFGGEIIDYEPINPGLHNRWWDDNHPRLGVGNRKPDHPACVHWRARGPELAKIAAGGRGADIAVLWAEFDASLVP